MAARDISSFRLLDSKMKEMVSQFHELPECGLFDQVPRLGERQSSLFKERRYTCLGINYLRLNKIKMKTNRHLHTMFVSGVS